MSCWCGQAYEALKGLMARGLSVHMATGDSEVAAATVAQRAGIEPKNVHAQLLPQDKATLIKQLQQDGHTVRWLLLLRLAHSWCSGGVCWGWSE